jgi:hypothetical protein
LRSDAQIRATPPIQTIAENDRGRADRHKLVGVDWGRHCGGGGARGLKQEGKTPPTDERTLLLPRPSEQQHAAKHGGYRDVHGRHRLHVELHGLPPTAANFAHHRKEASSRRGLPLRRNFSEI